MHCPHCGGILYKAGKRTYTDGRTVQRMRCKDCGKKRQYEVDDVLTENVRLAKQKQRYQDINRIERKSFREFARIENAVEAYSEQLVTLFERQRLHKPGIIEGTNNEAAGVIQFSDVHFNELIDLKDNKYDFTIASKRTKHFVEQTKKYFLINGITNVLVALTGDLMNSDRRLDEMLNQATNRSQATFLAVDILSQALQELMDNFNVSVACVTGNEGRVHKEPGWSPVIATDNYDFTIFNILKYLYKDSKISFVEGDPTELVVNVAGQNLLLLHGNGAVRHASLDKSINQIIGRYSMKGVNIDYIIMGHVHSASVGDNYSRSSSMAGTNDYSDKGLNLAGRASQNCYIFYENGNRDGIKIDLQNVSEEMYDIDKSLVAYNTKSATKNKGKTTIFEIVI